MVGDVRVRSRVRVRVCASPLRKGVLLYVYCLSVRPSVRCLSVHLQLYTDRVRRRGLLCLCIGDKSMRAPPSESQCGTMGPSTVTVRAAT